MNIDLRWLKYFFMPAAVLDVNHKERLCVRKRLLHKGYQLLIGRKSDCPYEEKILYEKVIDADSLLQIETYIKQEYNKKVSL